MSAEARFRSLIDRILRLREEQDAIGEDVKAVYAEAKGEGYDKTAMGALVAELRKREKNPAKVEEAEAILDLYRTAYEQAGVSRTGRRVPARENIEEFGVGNGAVTNPDAAAMPVGSAGSGHTGELRIAITPAAAPNAGGSVAGRTGVTGGESAATSLPVPASPTVPDGGSSEPGSLAGGAKSEAAATVLAGQSAQAESLIAQREQAVTFSTRSKRDDVLLMRPNCRRPDDCQGGYGSKHCGSCQRAAREVEAA